MQIQFFFGSPPSLNQALTSMLQFSQERKNRRKMELTKTLKLKVEARRRDVLVVQWLLVAIATLVQRFFTLLTKFNHFCSRYLYQFSMPS